VSDALDRIAKCFEEMNAVLERINSWTDADFRISPDTRHA
jgi:hypothetical protein